MLEKQGKPTTVKKKRKISNKKIDSEPKKEIPQVLMVVTDGFEPSELGGKILIKKSEKETVPPPMVNRGLNQAKKYIISALNDLSCSLNTEYSIKQIELEISISAKGEFMGFGTGGDASIKLVFSPKNM